MTKEQRDAVRKSLNDNPLNERLLWLLDAADQRDRAVELLQETVSWPGKDWQERRDAFLADVTKRQTPRSATDDFNAKSGGY